MKSKNSKYYDNSIYTWTDLDVRKREVATNNNLNWIEVFSDYLDEVIKAYQNI